MKIILSRIFLLAIVLCIPQLVFSQASGGAIRRPVKKPPTSAPAKPSRPSNTSNGNSHRPSASATVSSDIFEANGVSFKMIRVDGLGSPFYIGETEVTQALWEAVMGSNPSYFKGADRPVEQVSWDDCQTFINKLNAITKKKFRLPKEKEWEYAAKGGNKSHGFKYSGSSEINDVAWYDRNACDGVGPSSPDYGTHNVKTKKANELGIYDMSGNVREWCEDLYCLDLDFKRVNRGGYWSGYTGSGDVSAKYADFPFDQSFNLGLRLALYILYR